MGFGTTLVGEQGPEIVDFQNPGRVYSNRDSKALFNNAEVVQELRALRDELTKLRQDQQEQTGHLITTNYDANNRAAGKVAEANDKTTSTALWTQRSAAKIM